VYENLPLANQPPFPGAREVCQLIQQTGGCNLIVTHRSVFFTQRLLAAHHLSKFFAGVISTTQGYPQKPDPTIVLEALKKYKLNPATTLLIGNRSIDIEAGRSAGVRTCLFGNVEQISVADLRAESYSELLQWLRSWDEQQPERSSTDER
jgi:phosphoglycolate phosphatase-like HAD superfamily hydrolase